MILSVNVSTVPIRYILYSRWRVLNYFQQFVSLGNDSVRYSLSPNGNLSELFSQKTKCEKQKTKGHIIIM